MSFIKHAVVPPTAGANFGDLVEDVAPGVHQPGASVRATFRSACPRNNVRLESTFLTVERQADDTAAGTSNDGDGWEVVGAVLKAAICCYMPGPRLSARLQPAC